MVPIRVAEFIPMRERATSSVFMEVLALKAEQVTRCGLEVPRRSRSQCTRGIASLSGGVLAIETSCHLGRALHRACGVVVYLDQKYLADGQATRRTDASYSHVHLHRNAGSDATMRLLVARACFSASQAVTIQRLP
jgi:hypothetical protein